MAIGGGFFKNQDKILPGAYINFKAIKNINSNLGERGIVAMPMALTFGNDKAFMLSVEDFKDNSIKYFGYEYTHEKLKNIREVFKNASKLIIANINNTNGYASNVYASCIYKGSRGNDLSISIKQVESDYIVNTFLDDVLVDSQKVSDKSQLKDNDFVTFKRSSLTLSNNIKSPLSGGTDKNGNCLMELKKFIDQIQSYSFNILAIGEEFKTFSTPLVSFVNRLRNEEGIKFQVLLPVENTQDFNNIGVIATTSIPCLDDDNQYNHIYFLAGALAGCLLSSSITNKEYNGEYHFAPVYSNLDLKSFIKKGIIVLHNVSDKIRVLSDINTLTNLEDNQNEDFKNNQTIRVIDQIGNDINRIFSNHFLGKVQNDPDGRISLWVCLVKYFQELANKRAIENFSDEDIKVELGANKKSIVITSQVNVLGSMNFIYMSMAIK